MVWAKACRNSEQILQRSPVACAFRRRTAVKICMIGAGYVGLGSGACFAEFGWTVICVDQDENRIAKLKRGEIPIYESSLEELWSVTAPAPGCSRASCPAAVQGAELVLWRRISMAIL